MLSRPRTASACFLAGFVLIAGCLATVDESKIGQSASDSGRPPDALLPPDASAPDGQTDATPARSGMPCGTSETCNAPEQVCCMKTEGSHDPRDGTCKASAKDEGDCFSGDLFRCMGELDCDQMVCCVERDQGTFTKSACKASCSDTILCDSVSACPVGQRCVKSGEFPGLSQCQ